MSSSPDFSDYYNSSRPVHPSMGGRVLSGLDVVAYEALFTDGIQTTCAAGDKCKADASMSIEASTHCCMGCSLSIHCAMMCGQLFDEFWRQNNTITVGFNPSALPPYGQGKFKDYADRLGETGLYICHRCMDGYHAKITSSNIGGVVAEPLFTPPPGLDPITRATYFTNERQTKCAAGDRCRSPNAGLSCEEICIVCKLAVHSVESCRVFFRVWTGSVYKSKGFSFEKINHLFPSHALEIVGHCPRANHPICARCIGDMETVLS